MKVGKRMRYFKYASVLVIAVIITSSLYAEDIYTVPNKDLPFREYQYDVTINVEINVYGDTELEEIEESITEESMTETFTPYTDKNMQTKTIKTKIIENDFVSVHVLKTSPSQIGVFTENLFTGNASEDIEDTLSSLENSDSN
jgi:hypothetical protein